MKRTYIYVIVVLLTITLVSADYIIGKDLKKIIPLDDTSRTIDDSNDYLVKEIESFTTLTIKNEQNSDEIITYKYVIKAPNLVGALRYECQGKEKYMVFTAAGEGSLELKSNESIILYDIPLNLEYTVTQITTNEKYIIKVNQEENNTFTGRASENDIITFNNSTKKDIPKKEETKEQTIIEEPKKEDNKVEKKDIPNTGAKEKRVIIILLISAISIICFKKIKVKRFE